MHVGPARQLLGAIARVRVNFALLAGLAAASCGGGGDPGGTLTVDLRYDGHLLLFRPSIFRPTITGLGGRAPSCSLTSGSPPPGMTFNADCSLTGTPTQPGSFPLVVHLGAEGASNQLDWNTGIYVAGPSLTYSVPATVQIGSTVDLELLNKFWTPTAQDQVTYSVTGSLPPGVTIDPATGRISGVPTASGFYSFQVAVQTVNGNRTAVETQKFPESMTVVTPNIFYNVPRAWAALPFSTTPSLPAGPTFGFSAASLPPGLTIDPSTGTIAGTPTRPVTTATYPIHVTVDGVPFTENITLGVASPVSVNYSDSPGLAGLPYFRPPVATNFSGASLAGITYGYALGAGAVLPPGLIFDAATGVLSGTVTSPGSFNVPIDVTISLNGISFVESTTADITIR